MLIALFLFIRFFSPSDPSAMVASGDEAFLNIDYPAAASAYASALHDHPEDPEILWRLARVYVCIGEVVGEHEHQDFYKTAEAYARWCIQADSASSDGHTWLAGALGYIALDAGMREQIRLSSEVRSETDWALELNPNDDVAYSIKGSLYRALGNVSWLRRQVASIFIGGVPLGGYEESEAALKKAISLAPAVMRHHYELAVLYIDWCRNAEAMTILEHAATLRVQTAIDRPRLANIKELLSTLEQNP